MNRAKRKEREVVLVGGGHANVQVLKLLMAQQLQKEGGRAAASPPFRVTLISARKASFYSGMLPGCIAGLYSSQDTQIELQPLCEWCGARFVRAEVVRVDAPRSRVLCRQRKRAPVSSSCSSSSSSSSEAEAEAEAEADERKNNWKRTNKRQFYRYFWMEYDVLALNIGSQTRELPFLQQGQEEEEEEGEGAHAIIATRPIGKLLNKVERWEQQRQQQQRNNDDMKDEVVIVGGGAAGVELAWALQARFQKNQLRKINVTLIDNKVALLQHEMGERVSKAVTAEMHRRGIRCLTAVEVTAVLPSPSKTIHLSDGTSLPFDLLVWATGAAPSPLFSKLDKRNDEANVENGEDEKGGKEKQTADEGEKEERWTDDRGFLRVKKTLQALVGMPKGNVFAAGDCCSIDGYEWVAKAGVYAVREGPILAENIIRYLRNQELKEYEPQKSFLALLMTGDGRAIASWKGFAWTGTMPWRLKHKIDTTFMHSFQVQHLPASPFQREAEHDAEEKGTSVT